MPATTAACLSLLLTGVLAGCSTPVERPVAPTWWHPVQGQTWQVQLSGAPDLTVPADVVVLDLDEVSTEQVQDLREAGRTPVCYFSAGSFEPWRSDAGHIPPETVGKVVQGWPDERWLDVRAREELLPVMTERIRECRRKGFLGVDADNVGVVGNDTGFEVSTADEVAYIRALADAAHAEAMAFGLKNATEALPRVMEHVDFAVNEECHAYDECGAYSDLLRSGRPVVNLEYSGDPATICADRPEGMVTLLKDPDLGPVWRPC